MTQMKMFLSRNECGIVEGAGGYVVGDGELPADFNPDEFMKRFSRATIMAAVRGNKQAMETILAEIPSQCGQRARARREMHAAMDEDAEAVSDRVAASIDEAPVFTIDGDLEQVGEQAIKVIEDMEG
jgi:hypothetical protein